MNKKIIHVGLPKTGTTFFKTKFFQICVKKLIINILAKMETEINISFK